MPFSQGPRKTTRKETGELTYPCMWIGCEKTFGTAGHARRHEKTHAGNTPYSCPYCNKKFGRSDVRGKHVATMHPLEGDDQSISDSSSRKAQKRSHSLSPAQSMNPMLPPSRSSSFSHTWSENEILSVSGSRNGVSQTLYPGAGGGNIRSTTSSVAPSNVVPVARASDLVNLMLPPPTPFSIDTSSSGFLDPSTLSTGTSNMGLNFGLGNDGTTSSDILNPLDSNWQLFSHVFGWGLDNDIDLDIGLQNSMFDNSDIGPISSTEHLSAAWLMSTTPRQGSPAAGGGMEEQQRDPFGRNHDNPWPNMFKPKVPDRPLTLGGVKASPRQNRRPTETDLVGASSRNAMLSLVYLAHQAHWLMPDIDDFPDQSTLSDFVDLYFEKFHPTCPFLHRPSIISGGETPPVLLMAVAAVGATFADPEFKPLAVALSELVRRMVQWMRASDQRSKFDRNAMSAYLLQTVVGIACGSREMMLHAEISRASLLTTTRRLHLLRPGKSAVDELLARSETPSLEERHKAYIEDEGRRRLGWAAYTLDSQMSNFLGIPAMFSIHEIGVPLPGDETAWEASDAATWSKFDLSSQTKSSSTPFLKLLGSLMKGQTNEPLTDFGRSIVSHTLYRLSIDAYHLHEALSGDPDLTPGLASPLNGKPQATLLALAKAPSLFDDPTSLRLSSAALYHHSRIAFAHPGLLEHVKCASGKFEPDMSKKTATKWLRNWVKDGSGMRRVLWHAGVLNALLAEFPRGALGEQFWTFDCGLIFWAVAKYGASSLKTADIKSALFAANWFDVEPPAVWVQHGGQIFFPFLGSSSSLSVNSTLQFFIDRLGTIPWGMASLFKQVLEKLLEGEGRVDNLEGD